MNAPPLIINFVPTGMVPTKSLTPFVPVHPSEIIEQVHEAYEVGITLVHLHARDEEERPTYRTELYDEILSGLRKHCPELVMGISLSGRNFPELEKRSEALWLQPDLGSLTLSSLNFVRQASVNAPATITGLLERMDHYGVHPELECFDAGMVNVANYLVGKGQLRPPYYFNLLVGNLASAQLDAIHVGAMLKDLPAGSHWALAGLGNTQLGANALGVALGGGVRIGIEDNIWFDRGRTQLATNLDLLRRVHGLAETFERPVMPSREFGEMGFYNTRYRTSRGS